MTSNEPGAPPPSPESPATPAGGQQPAAPPPQPPTPPPAQPAAATGGSNDDRTIAILTHLSGIVFSFIVPLVIWLVYKDQAGKSYLVTEAKEALNFQIAVLIGYIVCTVLMVILIGALLMPLVWLFNIVFCILAAVKVSNDGSYRYPLTLRLIN